MKWIIFGSILILFLIIHFLIKKFRKKDLLENIKNVSLLIKTIQELKIETEAFRVSILMVYKDSNTIFKIGEKVKVKMLNEVSEEELDDKELNEKYLNNIQDSDFIKFLSEVHEKGICKIEADKLTGKNFKNVLKKTGSKYIEIHKIGADGRGLFYLSLSSKTKNFSTKKKQDSIKKSLNIIKKLFKDSNPDFIY